LGLLFIFLQIEREKVHGGAECKSASVLKSGYDRRGSALLPVYRLKQENAMLKGIQWFLERLIERLIPIVATCLSSTVETIRALGQAEHQSQLEEAARRYEAEGKIDIAANLRNRAKQLTSDDPAAAALDIFQNVVSDGQQLLPPADDPTGGGLHRLPDIDSTPRKPRRKKGAAGQSRPHDA
jgi:hypothetical protein